MGKNPRKLLVLYASQTENALDAAERIGREAERRGCTASIVSTDEFDASSLPHQEAVVFVVSTTWQGDSPDSFKVFWRFLLQKNLGNSWLQRVRFAVFGLGDSGYQKYNVRNTGSWMEIGNSISHFGIMSARSSGLCAFTLCAHKPQHQNHPS